MALYSGWAFELGFRADVDFNTNQYYFVSCASTVDYVKLATAASNGQPLGVIQNDPRAGGEATVRILGVTKVAASDTGGAIAYGDYVCSGSHGMAVLTAASAMQGIAMSGLGSNASGYISVLLLPSVPMAATDNTP